VTVLADLSIWHILILLLVVVLVFGTKRIPEIGSSIGKGIQEFKRGLREVTSDEAARPAPPPPPPPLPPAGQEPASPRPASGAPKRLGE
jgi:sec-independent protein translocase protein TatA